MSFDPCNHALKIRESIWDSNSHNGSSFGSVRVHSLTLFCTLGSTRCNCRASLLARNLASLCLGREPKARVTTEKMLQVGGWSIVFFTFKACIMLVSSLEDAQSSYSSFNTTILSSSGDVFKNNTIQDKW
jgi:hypothetical protein